MSIELRPAAEEDVRTFITWRYPPPYDGYNITGDPDELVTYFLLPSVGCHVLVEAGELIGFCTFGADAQVPGGDYHQNHLDIGLGIRPDLTGRGRGRRYVASVVAHALERAPTLRVTIAEPNRRAAKVWEANGFRRSQLFRSPSTVMGADDFAVYVRQSESDARRDSTSSNPSAR